MKKMFGILSLKIGKADLRLKLKKYGIEAILVFSLMKIGKADLRLKWKKWEMFVPFFSSMKIGKAENK